MDKAKNSRSGHRQHQSYKEILLSEGPFLDSGQLDRLRKIGNSQHNQGSSIRTAFGSQKSATVNLNRMTTRSVQRLMETLKFNGETSQKQREGNNSHQVYLDKNYRNANAAAAADHLADQISAIGQKSTISQKNRLSLADKTRSTTHGLSLTGTPRKRNLGSRTTAMVTPRASKCRHPTTICQSAVHKDDLCKIHYLQQVQKVFRGTIHRVYKNPETAFATLNFKGEASIGIKDILNHMVMKLSGLDPEDVKSYLLREKVFKSEASQIDFPTFKKYFFPQLMLIQDSAEGELVKQEDSMLDNFKQIKNSYSLSHIGRSRLTQIDLKKEMQLSKTKIKEEQETYVRERLSKLTKFLRDKFQNTWISVRKAFLDLDIDKDGEISPEDIMRFFGDANNNLFDYNDLVKILEDLDVRKKGTLCYNDFCKWMGGAIHKSEGFYFRHDSIKNTAFEANIPKMDNYEHMRKIGAKKQTTQEIMQQLATKFEFQWKTLQSAFKHLNMGHSGKLQQWELKYFCNHWGFNMDDAQFEEVFNLFDIDQDGEISYQDLQKSAGSILNPPENFYFRQDRKIKGMGNMCSEPDCNFAPVGYTQMCMMHNKQMKMKSMTILTAIKDRIGKKWDAFLDKLKKEAVKKMDLEKSTDGISVELKFFVNLLKSYGGQMTDIEKKTLIKTFVVKSEEKDTQKISLKPILQLKNHQKLQEAYSNIQYRSDDFQDNIEVDTAGYFGTNYRINERLTQQFTPLHDIDVVVGAFVQDNKMLQIQQTIRTIDKEKNGFVTNQELEDILKLFYKEQLGGYDVKPVLRQFSSQSNRLLIDYSKFKEAILEKLQEYENSNTPGQQSPQKQNNDRNNGRRQANSAFGGYAGVWSDERKFTALDAIHGYDKFGNTTEGLFDQKFARNINLCSSARNQNKTCTKTSRNNESVFGGQSCSASMLCSPARQGKIDNGIFSRRSSQTKLVNQKETFGILRKKKNIKIKINGKIAKSTEKKSSGKFYEDSGRRTAACFFNQRKSSVGKRELYSKSTLEKANEIDSPYKAKVVDQQQLQKRSKQLSTISGLCKTMKMPSSQAASPLAAQQTDTLNNNHSAAVYQNIPVSTDKRLKQQKKLELRKHYAKQNDDETSQKTQSIIMKNGVFAASDGQSLRSRILQNSNFMNKLQPSRQMLAKQQKQSVQSATSTNFFNAGVGSAVNNKARLTQKLSYDWKNIFRSLRQQETYPKGQGYVTKTTFEQVLHENNVTLTRHEFKILTSQFREDQQQNKDSASQFSAATKDIIINYIKMSKDLNLHSNKLAMIQPQFNLVEQQQNIKQPHNNMMSQTKSQLSSSHSNLVKLRQTKSSITNSFM